MDRVGNMNQPNISYSSDFHSAGSLYYEEYHVGLIGICFL